MPLVKDISGQRFGRLTALHIAGEARRAFWLCQCDCGNQCIVEGVKLRTGNTKSCGCLRQEGRPKEHGHSGQRGPSPTYTTWANMVQRCSNPSRPDFRYYGGRGIKVCIRWLEFANFLADMGERPTGLSLDRIDSNGNYELGNCHWATVLEQVRNRRPQKLKPSEVIAIRADDRVQHEIARDYNVSRECVSRIKTRKNWSLI